MSECGLGNLGACLPEKFFEYFNSLLSQPLQPLLNWNKSLMIADVDLQIFSYFWAIITYILSLFYGLFLMWAGLQFMISGYDAVRREKAKSWLRGVVIMIVLVQSSYLLYEVMIDIGASLTTGVFSLIDDNFFLLTVDNLPNFGLQLIFGSFYVIMLFVSLLILALRHVFICIGVVLMPIAVFCYFIPVLKEYGLFLLNVLFSLVFLGFFHAIILLSCSMLLGMPVFQDFKILLMITAFQLVIISSVVIVKFAATKSLGFGIGGVVKIVSKLV